MDKKPNESKISAFRAFVSRLMSLHYQLHSEYHIDWQLRDKLLNAVTLLLICDAIRDRNSRTVHQLINRIGNRL